MESEKINELKKRMIEYYSGDPKRISHFIKVFSFAEIIGENEKLEKDIFNILKVAALVHDIGIKESVRKYGSCNGKQQEIEGPPIAEKMLRKTGFDEKTIERVCFLVGHHHTYKSIDGLDFQILVEADFLVNYYEDNISKDAIVNSYSRIFKTETGIKLCKTIYDI